MNAFNPTDHHRVFYRHRTTGQFLFNPSDPGRRSAVDEPLSPDILAHLGHKYPDMRFDQEFSSLLQSRFSQPPSTQPASASTTTMGALMIRPDLGNAQTHASGNDRRVQVWDTVSGVIAKVLANYTRETGAVWGVFTQGVIGILLEEINATGSRKIARRIRRELAKQSQDTVSTGIALHPTLDYPSEEILANAFKALDHAAFFDGNATVVLDAITLNIAGDLFYQEGDLQGAMDEYARGLKLDPSNVNLHNSLGVCYGVQKNYPQALEEFEAAMALDPEEVLPVYNCGLVKRLSGDLPGALASFLEAHAKNHTIYEIVLEMGKLLLEMDDFNRAESYLQKAIDVDPDNSAAHRLLGHCRLKQDRVSLAASAFEKAVKCNPNDAEALSSLGHLYGSQGQNKEIAQLFCQQSVALAPQNGLYYHRLGEVYMHAQRMEEALAEFKRAMEHGYDSRQQIDAISANPPADDPQEQSRHG